MNGQLYINNKDAYTTWGVAMGNEFLTSLLAPVPLKDFIENKSRLAHGKEVIYNDPKMDEREVNLLFYISGSSASDHMAKLNSFKTELLKGIVEIRVPGIGTETYRLTYLKSASFAMNENRTFSQLSVKFNEPNPANRN